MDDINCTTGEWRIEAQGKKDHILITDEQDVTIATVWRQPLDTPEWVENNAKLMRAAKEMFDALKDIISNAEDAEEDSHADIRHARQLLARITSNFIDYNE